MPFDEHDHGEGGDNPRHDKIRYLAEILEQSVSLGCAAMDQCEDCVRVELATTFIAKYIVMYSENKIDAAIKLMGVVDVIMDKRAAIHKHLAEKAAKENKNPN